MKCRLSDLVPRRRLPGDRILDQLAGGRRWRRWVARSTLVGLGLAALTFAMLKADSAWWFIPSAAAAAAAAAWVIQWCAQNWNG